MSHFQAVCEYNTIHSQCRCASRNKDVQRVQCPTPTQCAARSDSYVPKHLRPTPYAEAVQ